MLLTLCSVPVLATDGCKPSKSFSIDRPVTVSLIDTILKLDGDMAEQLAACFATALAA